jgi:AraC-like DNA-binding protein
MMDRKPPVSSATGPVTLDARRHLPPDTITVRQGMAMLAQPLLRRPHAAQRFRFFDATLLLVHSGQLLLDSEQGRSELNEPLTLLAVAQDTLADIQKHPSNIDGTFRSTFLNFAPELIVAFHQQYVNEHAPTPAAAVRPVVVDEQLAETLGYCVRGMSSKQVSDREQRHRLLGLLLALAERGCVFARPSTQHIGDKLKGLLGPSPQRRWTTATAARELAMSEATLRRRLASENLRFESLLLDIRMHHAMALLQTTAWSIPQIAEASGYRASSRFTSRFRERFGCTPSRAR